MGRGEAGAFLRFLGAYERVTGGPLEVPVLAGVLPLLSARHAAFLHNEVPGIVIPPEARRRIDAAGDVAWRVGLDLALGLASDLREAGAAGLYVVPQLGRYDLAAELVESTARSLAATPVGRSRD